MTSLVYLAPGPFGAGGQFFGLGGLPLNAGTINTYAAGGTTPLATYTTSAGSVQNANPIVLGTDGRPPNEIWITADSYRFDLKDSLGNLIRTYDNLATFSSANVSFIQPETGAVTRTLQDKGRELLSVNDFMSDADKVLWNAGTEVDITTYLQLAIDALGDTSVTSRAGPSILIPGPGILSGTITVQRKALQFLGNGWGNRGDSGARRSYLRWDGTAGIPMIKFIDCWGAAGVKRLKLMGKSTAKPSAAIELNNTNTGVPNQQNIFEEIYLGGFSGETDAGTQFTDGIVWTGTNNNAEHEFRHLYVTGCSGYGLKQNSIQNVNIKLDQATFFGNGTGLYVCGAISGSNWNFSQNTVDIEVPFADAAAAQVSPSILCNNYYSELAGRMLTVAAGSSYRMTLQGSQFQITSSLNADGKIVLDEGNGTGSLTLRDFKFSQTSAPPAAPQISMRSSVAGAGQRQLILDNIIGWANLTGGTNGLNVTTRGATDRAYVFFRENAQAASASNPRVAQNFLVGLGADWDITRFEIPNSGSFQFGTDNTYDIGATASGRPKNLYFGAQSLGFAGAVGAPTYSFIGATNTGFYHSSGSILYTSAGTLRSAFVVDDIALSPAGAYKWASGAGLTGSYDTFLVRDAANTIAQKNVNADQINRQYGMNGGYWERGSASELLTLSTSGTTTDTTANLLPANSIIEAVVARVTTTITTATDWKLGDSTISGRFAAANAVMTAGSTSVGTVQADQTGTSGPRQTAASKVRVTTTGTPGAGVIRIIVFYRSFVAPTS